MDAFLEHWTAAGVELVALRPGESLTLGRAPGAGLEVDDQEVSRLHAVIEPVGEGWVVSDLGSRNGTAVNGVPVPGRRVLSAGDEIRVGRTRLVFRGARARTAETVGGAPAPELTAREREVLVALVAPVLAGGRFTEPSSTRAIAAELHVSQAAVKQHLSRMYDKFGIHDSEGRRSRLANEALARGAVTLEEVRAARGS